MQTCSKKYWIREHEELSAMVIEPEEREEDEMNLFTSLQTETYRDVMINPAVTEEQRDVVMKLLEEFHDVFTDVPGLTNLGEHSITLTTEKPIYSKPYSLSHAMQKEVEKELDSMLKLGVIEPLY